MFCSGSVQPPSYRGVMVEGYSATPAAAATPPRHNDLGRLHGRSLSRRRWALLIQPGLRYEGHGLQAHLGSSFSPNSGSGGSHSTGCFIGLTSGGLPKITTPT